MTSETSPESRFGADRQSTGHPLVEFVRSRSMQLGLWVGLNGSSQEAHGCFFHTDPWTAMTPPPHFESATSINAEQVWALDEEVDAIVSLATDENIEDGMESDTEVRMNRFVASRSVPGIQRFSARLTSGCTNSGAAADIVRILGRIIHEESHDERFWIATRLLRSDSPLARDASAVALEDLGDRRAVRALQHAVEVEPIPELRDDIKMALLELKRTTDGIHSSEA